MTEKLEPENKPEDKTVADRAETDEPQSPSVDRRLLEILVCPITKGPLDYRSDSQELISIRGDVAFPIRSGVPLMTPDAARPLTEAERAGLKSKKR